MRVFYLLIFIAYTLIAGTYWVDDNGAETWANAQSASPLSGTSCTDYATANTNAAAGDTVYYRAGGYTVSSGSAINPSNSGTSGNPIVFMAYNNERVVFTCTGGSSDAVNLDSQTGTIRNYIVIDKMAFVDFDQHLWIRRGSHNWIKYCSFTGGDKTGEQNASYIYRHAQYNYLEADTFSTWGLCGSGQDNGGIFEIGPEGLGNEMPDTTYYNLIEGCVFQAGAHHTFTLGSSQYIGIVRDNYMENSPWCPVEDPTYGTRNGFTGMWEGYGEQRTLMERNRWAYGGPKNKDEIGGNNLKICSMGNIIRFSDFVRSYCNGMQVTAYGELTDCAYNKVYNNTFWYSGYGDAQHGSPYWDSGYSHAIRVYEGASGSSVYDNVFINLLFYDNSNSVGDQYSILTRYYSGGWVNRVPIYQARIDSNWFDNEGDPKLVDLTGDPDYDDPDQFDFGLQSDSPCIDRGTYVTSCTINDATSFSVPSHMATSFWYDRGNMAGTWPFQGNTTIVSDSIVVTSSATTVTYTNKFAISSIDYDNDTIELTGAHGLEAGTYYIWIYSISDGQRVLYGDAADMGAHEYGTPDDPAPPPPAGSTAKCDIKSIKLIN